jgi:hypothetical protein
MKIDDQKIASLREKVNAADQEFDMAVTFHEVWKPAAFDDDLHKRMGASHATNAFLVVRAALRRELEVRERTITVRVREQTFRAFAVSKPISSWKDPTPARFDEILAARPPRCNTPSRSFQIRSNNRPI